MQLNQMIREAKGDCGERDTLDTNE